MYAQQTRILIADDNDMTRSLLRALLRGQEYDVIGEARNGQQAVEQAVRLKPDIICMDVMMPEMNGLEALCEIHATLPEIAVVMVTANADSVTVQEAIMNGASGFIVKPFNAARVLDALARVVARRTKAN